MERFISTFGVLNLLQEQNPPEPLKNIRNMGAARGKRRIEQVEPAVGDDVEAPAQKTTRPVESPQISGDQRFGETTEFLPLRQSSQATGQQEDDEQATDLVQGSQEMDDSNYATFILYGTLCYYTIGQLGTTLTHSMAQVVCRLKSSGYVIIEDMLPLENALP